MSRFANRRKRFDFYHLDIPTKANRILNLILIAMIFLLIRIWHLTVIQYDQRTEEAQKPRRKTIITPATRATIRDRFNIPLAINKVSYQATILYSQIQDIPSFRWQMNEKGQKIKFFKRKEHIKKLSQLLASYLKLDSERVEDLIHSKASYYSQTPFVIKEDLDEITYYQLKALEKEWPGIHMRILPKRFYPKGRVAADIIGYLGAINRTEYEKVLHEIKALNKFIAQQERDEEPDLLDGITSTQDARHRLLQLQAKAYTIHDYVGKTGIESVFEEQLRGYYGKKLFETDSKGNILRELPGSRPSLPGQRVLLTISAELQEYAEELLAQNEELRSVRQSRLGPIKKTVLAKKEPWIKGGAVVVMEPQTGEILTLASYPRFDPNDYIRSGNAQEQVEKKNQINRWFENETHIAQLWHREFPFKRERFDIEKGVFYDEEIELTWSNYLNFILPENNEVKDALKRIHTIQNACILQNQIDCLLELLPNYDLYTVLNFIYTSDEHTPYRHVFKGQAKQQFLELIEKNQLQINALKKQLDPFLSQIYCNYNKVLFIDLCRLIASNQLFHGELVKEWGNQSLEEYRNLTCHLIRLKSHVKTVVRDLFHQLSFKEWRKQCEKEFLQEKRKTEKINKSYPKPYLDYLDHEETIQFQQFWEAHQWQLIYAFINDLKSSNDLISIDLEDYIPRLNAIKREKCFPSYLTKAIASLNQSIENANEELAISYLKSMRSYSELNRPLLGNYRYLRKGSQSLEQHLAAAFYPKYGFGYGRSHAYRQASIQGSLFKLVTAYEALVQSYRRKNDPRMTLQELNPMNITDEVFTHKNISYVGYDAFHKPIPQLYKGGRLPRSLAHQNIGRVDLIRALEYSSNPYFALLAGEYLENPEDLAEAARQFSFGQRTGIDLPAEIAGKVPTDLATNRTGLYAMAIGQHSLVVTPLQTAVMLAAIANGGKILKPKIVKLTAGCQIAQPEEQIICLPCYPYQKSLAMAGIDFPLFTAFNQVESNNLVQHCATTVKHQLFMPHIVRQVLLKGLKAVTLRTYQENLSSLSRLYKHHPEAIRHFTELKDQLLGKTSTSESVENIDLDLEEGTNIYTHVWFGSIAFETTDKDKSVLLLKDEFGKPELIIVVYLRYGGYGKEAAPIAAQLLKKWREIKAKHAISR